MAFSPSCKSVTSSPLGTTAKYDDVDVDLRGLCGSAVYSVAAGNEDLYERRRRGHTMKEGTPLSSQLIVSSEVSFWLWKQWEP